VPTLAQQQKAVDAEVRQQIEAVFAEFQDEYNKHDAAAIAALYRPDAVELRLWRGLLSGQEAIRRIFAFDFASGGGKMASELVQLCPVGNAICEIAHSNVGAWKDETMVIYVHDGESWKIGMAYLNGSSGT
jgi:ketosteroid isomerase-like protein